MIRRFKDVVPGKDNLGMCMHCQCIVLIVRCGPLAFIIDPDATQRAIIRKILCPASIKKMGFGSSFGCAHQCDEMPRATRARQGLFSYASSVLAN
jgi:hypothetical protein